MRTVTIASNTTLFHIAGKLLGDPTAWSRIATINGLSDPLVGAGVTLVVPPLLVATDAAPAAYTA